MLTQRRRRGLPENLAQWQETFGGIVPQSGGHTGRAYLDTARIFAAERMDDVAALFAWEAMRAGARWRGLLLYLRVALRGLGRTHTVAATAQAWLKEPAHQLLRAGGAPDRPQF